MMCIDEGKGNWAHGGRLELAAVACLVVASAGAAAPADDIATAITSGDAGLALRYRYEHVEQDGFERDADASTLRVRLNYGTGSYRGLNMFIEFDYVAELLADNFNSGGDTSPDRSLYPVVADPHGSDLNQLYIEWQASDAVSLRAGRQRILLDNQRFVGGVGWRQNEQTYDGIAVRYSATSAMDVRYAWVGWVNRIFGDRSASGGRHDGNVHLVNAGYSLSDNWTLTPYAYLIDNDDQPTFSTATFGARLTASFKPGGRSLSLTAELARQRDAYDNPVDYAATYWRVDGRLALSDSFNLTGGYELLGGNIDETGKALRTPLATLHAFNGWADQFLTTPDAGLADLFAGLGLVRGDWSYDAVYHDFRAEAGNAKLGRELDISISRKFGERYQFIFKSALFDGEGAAAQDTTKAWLVLSASY